MEIVLTEELFNLAATAIDTMRPELLAAYTKGFAASEQPPYNENKPLPSIQLSNTGVTFDYDFRGSKATFVFRPGQLTLSLGIGGAAKRSPPTPAQEVRLNDSLALSGAFLRAKKGIYPLLISDAVFSNMSPSDLQQIISWIVADAISATTLLTGFPVNFDVIEKKLTLLIDMPEIVMGAVHLSATVKP